MNSDNHCLSNVEIQLKTACEEVTLTWLEGVTMCGIQIF